MENCIFCKIVENKIPSVKIYEDKECLTVLDAYPNLEGQTLILSKKHYTSYPFDVPDDIYNKALLVAKKIGKSLDKALSTRTCLVIEGFHIDHFHIKLFPLKKGDSLSTSLARLGSLTKTEDLNKTAEKIRRFL
ncbi:MAG: HIT family protein [Candidatus Woesearchaeota archaeon]|nr:MAG: HIT family protein [Candidatus Woesearchaeota archaeon]